MSSKVDYTIQSSSPSRFSRASAIHEPEISRLQREMDHFTHALDQERRQAILLDDEIKRAKDTLREKKANAKQIMSSDQESRLQNTFGNLEKQLQSETKKLNTLQSNSAGLRRIINNARREKMHLEYNVKCLNTDVATKNKMRHERSMESIKCSRIDSRSHRQIKTIRSQSSHVKRNYSERVSHLNSFIQEDRVSKVTHLKKIEETINTHLQRQPDAIAPAIILRQLVTTWEKKLADQKKVLDNYLQYIASIRNGFGQISHSTGIKKRDDIVVQLLKSEDQMHTLIRYLTSMQTKIEKLEQKTNRIESRHASTATELENEHSEDANAMAQGTKLLEDTQGKFKVMVDSVVKLTDNIQSSMDLIQGVLAQFRESEIELRVAEHYQDEDLSLNENVVLPLIAELEEYIYNLEVHLAYQNKEKLAAAKPIPFKIMPTKSFSQKQLSVQKLVENNELLEDPQLQDSKKPLSKAVFVTLAKEAIVLASKSFDLPPLRHGRVSVTQRSPPKKEAATALSVPPKRHLVPHKTKL